MLLPVAVSAQFWLSGEALLLRPASYRPYAAIKAPANANINTPLSGRWEGNTKPSYDWGYQVTLGYERCCYDARASWSSWIHTDPFSLSADASQRIWLTFIDPTGTSNFLSPGELRRRDQYRVQMLDGECGYSRVSTCTPFTVRAHAGVRYARIRYDVNIDASGTQNGGPLTVTDRWESDLQGTGPRAGLDVHYRLPFSLQLFGDIGASLLLGSAKGRYLDFLNSNGVFVLTADRISPMHLITINGELRFGFRWCWSLFDIEAGYTLNYFSQGTQRAQFFDDSSRGVSAVTLGSFAMDGWNFSMGITY